VSRKRLHVDIVILPLIRNLAFTCKTSARLRICCCMC